MEKFDVTCRTCKSQRSNLVEISSSAPGSDTLKLRDWLFTVCPSLSIEYNDRLPQKICYFCSKQLEIAYKFQLQCKKSHKELWNMVEADIKSEPTPSSAEIGSVEVKSECLEPNKSDNKYENEILQEENFSETFTDMTDELEFLDEDDELMCADDNDREATEETTEPEEYLQPAVVKTVQSATAAENEATIVCCHCDKKFFTANGLKLHEKLAHKNLKPILVKAEILTIECKYCFQVFEKKEELLQHCGAEHKSEMAKELTCNVCHKTFSGKSRYAHHLMYHAKDHYKCPIKNCNRNYIVKYKLTDHMRRYHGMSLSVKDSKALQAIAKDKL